MRVENIRVLILRSSIFLLLLLVSLILIDKKLFTQEVGEVEKIEREIEKERLLREKIKEKKERPVIKEKPTTKILPPAVEEKIFIKKINVKGVTLLLEREINEIILSFENKELTLRQMQEVADRITDAYRQKGYVTSRAYLPPQKIKEGVLEIKVIEGATGEIEIKGNRYFRTSFLREKITLKKGEPFNYNILRKDLMEINAHPDRSCRAVLMAGKEPGTTDIVLEVVDRFPVHIGFEWDNFGSRYIGKDRYRLTLTHNNFLGLDDILTLQYQLAEAEAYRLASLHYLFPVAEDLEVGFFFARTKLNLGKDYKDLEARGKSRLYSIYATYSLIDEENIGLNLNLGFDYKDIFNFQLGNETSRDRMRVVKLGLDLDLTDRLGRTLIINELNFGIPKIMGGLDSQDEKASRVGSGGKFIKNNLSLLRLHRMPFDSTLLLKNQFQFSPYILPACEQFQIGGIANVRGYPPAEKVGDKGYAVTLEWSFPPYFIPKDVKLPFSDVKGYDALRFVIFYDWANTHLRSPQAGEEKDETLSGVGWGLRLTLPENFSARVDFAWPLMESPSDENHLHIWMSISKRF